MTSKEPLLTNGGQDIKYVKLRAKKKSIRKRRQHIYEGKDIKIISDLSSAILKAWKRVEQYISSLRNK